MCGCVRCILYGQEQLAVSRIGFIFMMYHASTWWYEIADLLRKLVLTGLVTFIAKGSSTQARRLFALINTDKDQIKPNESK